MTFGHIREITTQFVDQKNGPSHESVLRSWNILQKVRELLEKKTPPEVVIEIIDDLLEHREKA